MQKEVNEINDELFDEEGKKSKYRNILIKISIGVLIFIVVGNAIIFLSELSANSFDSKYNAEQIVKNGNIYNLYSRYTIGKVTGYDCDSVMNANDGKGRYFYSCTYSYNPTNNYGSTMLDREENDTVYIILMNGPADKFYYKTNPGLNDFIDEFMTNVCWGEDSSKLLNCY